MRTVRLQHPALGPAHRGKLRPFVAIAAALTLHAGAAGATAFFINQQSVKGLGRVDSGNTAAADELGTIFFNPAGLDAMWGALGGKDSAFSFGAELVIPRGTQDNAGSSATTLGTGGAPLPYGGSNSRNPTDPTPVPNVYYARRLGEASSIGVGVNVPFGLRAEFAKDWYGRYDAIEASLRTVNLSVVGAHRLSSALAVGGGVDVQYARTTLTTAIPNPLVPGGPTADTDARIATKGHAYTAGFNVGLMYAFGPDHRIGLHYRSGMKHGVKGNSEITGLPGPLAVFNGDVGAKADLKLPAIASAGFRARATDLLVVMGDLQWYDWSTFDEVRIRFDDGRPDGVRPTRYRDTWGVALGAEHRRPGSPLTTRGGLHYDRTPTVDGYRDTTVPDSDRLWLGLGATYELARGMSIDLAFNHVFFRKTRIALTRTFFDGTPVASTASINGAVETVVNTLAIDLHWRF